MFLPTNNMRNFHGSVIDYDSKIIGGNPIRFNDNVIPDPITVKNYIPTDLILNMNRLPLRDSKAYNRFTTFGLKNCPMLRS